MRWNIGSKALPALLFLAALGGEARLLAQPPTQPPEARLARGPRFLLASAGGAHPSAIDASPIDASQVPMLQQPISVHLENVTLEEALDAISTQSGLSLTYSRAVVPMDARVSLHAADLSLAAALTEVLSDAPVDVLVSARGHAALVPQRPAPAQRPNPTGTLTGQVTQAGEPVAGVTVTATSTSSDDPREGPTDDNGNYQLSDLSPGTYSLRFELEGLVPVTKEVQVAAEESTTLDVQMSLHEVREDIVVTGSRIRRAEVEGPSPVIFITREDLDRSGRATVGEALALLPQNLSNPIIEGTNLVLGAVPTQTVNLRGLGTASTLVLVNGRRMTKSGTSTGDFSPYDLNGIPLAAVERIEVLTDSASALYGSDAIGGVVNVILKQDYTGTDVSIDYGASAEGGAAERRVSFVTGGAKGSLRGTLSGEYFNRGRLATTDRSISRSDDQRSRGGRDFRATFSNVFSLDGQNLPGLDASFAGIPAGQDGRTLTPESFLATAGQLNLVDGNRFFDLIAASERWGVNSRLDWELGSVLGLFAEAGVTRTTNESTSFPSFNTTMVPASNPFNPFGVDVQVQWLASELGQSQRDQETNSLSALVGLEGRAGAWEWETSLGYSQNEFDSLTAPGFPDAALITALVNRTDPATALNVFGDGAGNSPEVLAELAFLRDELDGVQEVFSWDGQLNGVLAEWAGRKLGAAAGLEYREESFDNSVLLFSANPQVPSRFPAANDRELEAGYVELSLPVFGPEHQVRGVRALELQLAGRFESYSDFGETFNPRVALRWQPIASLAVRASGGTGFRAPLLTQLAGELNPPVQLQTTVFDPQRNESVVVDALFGGNPDLGPEESESWNVGLAWDLPFVPGLSLSTDVYGIRVDDQIANLFPSQILDAEALLPGKVTRAEPTPEDVAAGLPGRILFMDLREFNVSQARVRGVDLGLNYLKDTAGGRFDLRVNGSYIDRLTRQVTPTAPVEQFGGTTSAAFREGSPARFRGNLSLYWSRGAWEVGVTERYTGRVRDISTGNLHPRIDDHLETDLQLNYRWPGTNGPLAGTRIALGVENLFNADPPFRDVRNGFYSTLYSPRQAFPHLTITKSFGRTTP